jgi:hypothetical protein
MIDAAHWACLLAAPRIRGRNLKSVRSPSRLPLVELVITRALPSAQSHTNQPEHEEDDGKDPEDVQGEPGSRKDEHKKQDGKNQHGRSPGCFPSIRTLPPTSQSQPMPPEQELQIQRLEDAVIRLSNIVVRRKVDSRLMPMSRWCARERSSTRGPRPCGIRDQVPRDNPTRQG